MVYGKEIHLKTSMYSLLSKVLGKLKKKKSLYNQPKPYFFQIIIVKSLLDTNQFLGIGDTRCVVRRLVKRLSSHRGRY
jgi:hypothetical protein